MQRSVFLLALLVFVGATLITAQQPPPGKVVTFAAPIVFPSSGPFPTGIASGDFNNDGIPDILVGDFAASTAVSALGNGDGTFGDWVGGCGASDPASVVAVGRFDGKNLDALANDIYGGVAAVCLGDGTGAFPSETLLGIFGNNIVNGFATADFNGDGKDDLVFVAGVNNNGAGTPLGELYVYLSNGDGTFRAPKIFSAPINPVAVVTGDFNNDGKADVAVLADDIRDFGAYVAVLLGNGKGGFGPALKYRIPKNHGRLGFSPASAIAAGDFNNDGNLDLAVAISNGTSNSTSYVEVLLGNGDGTFRRRQIAPTGPNPLSIAVADFNGDGIVDLAIGNAPCAGGCDNPGSVSVLIGNGDGTFQPPQTFPVDGDWPLLTVADFNGDGKPDVATANGDSRSISVLLNTTPWPKAKH